MKAQIKALADIDPLRVELPHGTEVTTRVDRNFGDKVVKQGAVGRVTGVSANQVTVQIVGVGSLTFARSELTPRKAGQLAYAIRREAAWQALKPNVVVETVVGSRAWGLSSPSPSPTIPPSSTTTRMSLFPALLRRSWYAAAMSSTFASLGLSAPLQEVVAELGYQEPTPIQVEAIPLLLAGKDLIAQSKTGSGKTAAFALPILQRLDLESRALQALIVCPTRELAAQVAREIRKLGRKHQGLAVIEIVGGQPVRGQIDALERGVHVAVGTPGRLLDHLQRGTVDAGKLTTAVLDEADRMLDMGFGADVESILSKLPKERQTVMLSATFPSTIESMGRRHQRDAQRITIADTDGSTLRQFYLECERDKKLDALYGVMADYPHESALVFCNFKATVSELELELSNAGFSVDRLDGDLEQFERDQVLAKFRNQSVRILIATDVAGRGIDVEDLELVVNYELPAKPDIYVHRIGRTARAGKAGVAVSLISGREVSKIHAIERATGESVTSLKPRGESAVDVRALAQEAKMQTILISGGRKDKVRPGDILGALTGEAGGLRGEDIGKIEIQDRLSYVAVARTVARQAAKGLGGGRIKGKRFKATLL